MRIVYVGVCNNIAVSRPPVLRVHRAVLGFNKGLRMRCGHSPVVAGRLVTLYVLNDYRYV